MTFFAHGHHSHPLPAFQLSPVSFVKFSYFFTFIGVSPPLPYGVTPGGPPLPLVKPLFLESADDSPMSSPISI